MLSPPLTGVSLLFPVLTSFRNPPVKYDSELKSWQQNKDAPVLPLALLEHFMDA
jgi:hypothetical protein